MLQLSKIQQLQNQLNAFFTDKSNYFGTLKYQVPTKEFFNSLNEPDDNFNTYPDFSLGDKDVLLSKDLKEKAIQSLFLTGFNEQYNLSLIIGSQEFKQSEIYKQILEYKKLNEQKQKQVSKKIQDNVDSLIAYILNSMHENGNNNENYMNVENEDNFLFYEEPSKEPYGYTGDYKTNDNQFVELIYLLESLLEEYEAENSTLINNQSTKMNNIMIEFYKLYYLRKILIDPKFTLKNIQSQQDFDKYYKETFPKIDLFVSSEKKKIAINQLKTIFFPDNSGGDERTLTFKRNHSDSEVENSERVSKKARTGATGPNAMAVELGGGDTVMAQGGGNRSIQKQTKKEKSKKRRLRRGKITNSVKKKKINKEFHFQTKKIVKPKDKSKKRKKKAKKKTFKKNKAMI